MNHTNVKAGANDEILLQKHPGRKNVFGKFKKHFFGLQNRDLVFSTCVAFIGAQTRKQFENTLTLNVSRKFSSFADARNLC